MMNKKKADMMWTKIRYNQTGTMVGLETYEFAATGGKRE
jgi:hypothetical protein